MSDQIYYRINDWNENFETAKSRTIDHKSWGSFPLKHGAGYCRLMSRKSGASVYGSFLAMCSIVHQKPKEIRCGYLTDTGGIPGYPYDEKDISAMTRITRNVIRSSIEELIKIRWITPCDSTGKNIEGYHEDTTRIPRYPYTEERRGDYSIGEERAVPPLSEIKELWNELCKKSGLSAVQVWSETRKVMVKERWKSEWFADNWQEIFKEVHRQQWCRENHAGIEHVLRCKKVDNALRYFEGMKKNRKPKDTGFSITVRFSDDRTPQKYQIKDDEQLVETIERMGLTPFGDSEHEYLLDVDKFLDKTQGDDDD